MTKLRSKHRHGPSIPYATFKRLVKEISCDVMLSTTPLNWSEKATRALHEDAENFLAEHFQNANHLRATMGKKTLDSRAFQTAMSLAGVAAQIPDGPEED